MLLTDARCHRCPVDTFLLGGGGGKTWILSRAEESQIKPEIFCTFISSTRPGAFRSTNTCTRQDLLTIMTYFCVCSLHVG